MKKKFLGIFLFDKVEVLDFAGPFEVFSSTRVVKESGKRDSTPLSPFKLVTISEKDRKIITTGGLTIFSDFIFKNCPKLDVLIIPGGIGTRSLLKNKDVINWIKKHADIDLLCSVCTGSLLLAKAELLRNKTATTHREAINFLKEISPSTNVISTKRFVYDTYFTSAGVSAGIDLSLKIVEMFYGKETAINTARYMEYISKEY